jgi:GNAT superfamily N-acetyltransferase
VHRIMREAYLEYDGAVDPPMSANGESEAQVADAIRRGGAVLAWDGATPVGSARYRLSSEFVHIKRVCVLPSWRGRGIATAMLRYIEHLALRQGRAQARLQVRMSLSRTRAVPAGGLSTHGGQTAPARPGHGGHACQTAA